MLARCRQKLKKTFVGESSKRFKTVYLKARRLGFSRWLALR